ncbi:MAG: hypothetical protein R3C26_23445 [Calditrichia bacterium]
MPALFSTIGFADFFGNKAKFQNLFGDGAGMGFLLKFDGTEIPQHLRNIEKIAGFFKQRQSGVIKYLCRSSRPNRGTHFPN